MNKLEAIAQFLEEHGVTAVVDGVAGWVECWLNTEEVDYHIVYVRTVTEAQQVVGY